MDSKYLELVVSTLQNQGVVCASGLAEQKIRVAEAAHGFEFPPDLRALLKFTLPIGERFPDWREPKSEWILDRLAWPAESMCFDIEHNAFWPPSWQQRPTDLRAAQAIAREEVRKAPFLVPVYGHRYLPATPCASGNPVFSIYQTDIICYGHDLATYLFAEFGVPNPFPHRESPREIEFWSELERLNS